jgi:hypothetical protein
MLIPRFSIRWLLGLTTLSAGVSLVLSFAIRGEAWALGMVVGLGSLVLVAVLYAAAFAMAWFAWRTLGSIPAGPPGASPFARPLGGDVIEASVNDSPPITG